MCFDFVSYIIIFLISGDCIVQNKVQRPVQIMQTYGPKFGYVLNEVRVPNGTLNKIKLTTIPRIHFHFQF